jgi:hypothetical protein
MSSPKRRRRTRKHGTATLCIATVGAAIAAYRAPLVLAAGIAALAGILVTAAIILRHHPVVRQVLSPPRSAPATVAARAIPPAAPDKARPGGRRHARPAATRASTGDLFPPKSPRLLSVTPECAGGECAICPAPDECEHCSHDAAEIVAANQAAHDEATAGANGSAGPGY